MTVTMAASIDQSLRLECLLHTPLNAIIGLTEMMTAQEPYSP
jgi:hypothetical protein